MFTKFRILLSTFNVSSIPVCITLQRVSSNFERTYLIFALTDEDQNSKTIVYSCQVMGKILLWSENKNLQHILQLAVYASLYMECIIQFNLVQNTNHLQYIDIDIDIRRYQAFKWRIFIPINVSINQFIDSIYILHIYIYRKTYITVSHFIMSEQSEWSSCW